MESIPATVGILTFNSEGVLRRALESVKEFKEILICDGGSTDGTLDIARAFGARIIHQDPQFKNPNGTLRDFGGVRQQTMEAATYDWFLYIDSDETISDGLREEIRTIVTKPLTEKDPLVYRVPYGMMLDDRPVLYSSNFPGYQFRFFNRTSGARYIKQVHERIEFDRSQVRIGTLTKPWYTYGTRADAWSYLRDTRGYRRREAEASRNRSFFEYLRYEVVSSLRVFLGVVVKASRNYVLHGFKDTAPLGHEVGRALSPLFLMGDATLARMTPRPVGTYTLDETKHIRVFSIPAAVTNNPYLELLYGSIHDKEPNGLRFSVRPFSFFALFSTLVQFKPAIVHVHWETNIYGSRSPWISVLKMTVRFPLLFAARAFGARYVWTMHNLHAHDYDAPKVDALGRKNMWKLAHRVIIQNQTVAQEYVKKHDAGKVVFVPHGNYISVYGDALAAQQQSRAALALPDDRIILLALGAIRPYKKLELLMDTVMEAAERGVPLLLVIAGKGERDYVQSLMRRAQHSTAIKVSPSFVPDLRIPIYFSAADYALFAHGDSSLSSGALLLALSYGAPVITFPLPAAEIISEGKNGYVVQDHAELFALLQRLPSLPKIASAEVIASVADLSWDRVGQETMAVYESLYT